MPLWTILPFTALSGFCVSCEAGNECGGSVLPPYRVINHSEHIVALVNRPACRELPDSLILQPGESFDFESGMGSYGTTLTFFGVYGYKARLVYYDGRYAIRVRDLPIQRQPTESSNFYVKGDWLTYAFTDEDYAYAVKHGTDLRVE